MTKSNCKECAVKDEELRQTKIHLSDARERLCQLGRHIKELENDKWLDALSKCDQMP